MKEHISIRVQVALGLLCVVFSILVGVFVAHNNIQDFEEAIRIRLVEQRSVLISLAELTDSNGADESISQIITDCSRRNEYESLLITLDTLSQRELLTLQTLSDSCGGFYSERKALMVAKFERELESYKDLITLLTLLTRTDIDIYELSRWNELFLLEKNRSTLLTDQNLLQEKIITLLISGATPTSVSVQKLVAEAREIAQLLMTNGQTIDSIRESLNR